MRNNVAYAVLFTNNVSSAVSAHVAHPQTPCPPLKKVKFSCLVGLLQVITLKEWPTLDPLPRPKRHVCSFRRSTKRYIASEVPFMGTGMRRGWQVNGASIHSDTKDKTEKAKVKCNNRRRRLSHSVMIPTAGRRIWP